MNTHILRTITNSGWNGLYVVACDYNFFFRVFIGILFSINGIPLERCSYPPENSPHPSVLPLKYLTVWNYMFGWRSLASHFSWLISIFCLKKGLYTFEGAWVHATWTLAARWVMVIFYCLNCSSCIVQAIIIHIVDFVHSSVATIDVFTIIPRIIHIFRLIFPIWCFQHLSSTCTNTQDEHSFSIWHSFFCHCILDWIGMRIGGR